MKLSSMILKNITCNAKKYSTYLLGNSFIICILFMFFSLASSKVFMSKLQVSAVNNEVLISILVLMVAFSLMFILYTTISFTKYRAKELGIYFTIGLTSKDIVKVLSYENFFIAISSFILGGLSGTILFKLFYMAVLKVLNIDNINIEISFEAYIYIAIIAILIFIFNKVYQIIFLKRFSILQILKSSSQKHIGRFNWVLGIIGIIVIIFSLIIFEKATNYEFDDPERMLIISFIATIISLYFAIDFIMHLIVKGSKRFKKFYNNNILFLNLLSHRFTVYRMVLYTVILLVVGGMLSISIPYSMYKSSTEYINSIYPYDLSFVIEKDLYNENLKNIIKDSGAEIKSFGILEGINVLYFQKSKDQITWSSPLIMAVSQNNYNRSNKDNEHINKGNAVFNYSDADSSGDYFTGGLVIDFHKDDDYTKSTAFRLLNHGNSCLFNDYIKHKKGNGYLYIAKKNVIYKDKCITNSLDASKEYPFIRGLSITLNNEDYNKLKGNSSSNSIYYDVLVNLNNNSKYKDIERNLMYELNKIGGEKLKGTLVLKQSKLIEQINNDKFKLFTFSFLGIMLLIGSAAILYFKVFTSIDNDKKMTNQLFKMGLTYNQIRIIIVKEVAAVFLVPPVIAISLVSYYFSRAYKILNHEYGNSMWGSSLIVFTVYGVIQIAFFILTTNKYLKEIRNNIYERR